LFSTHNGIETRTSTDRTKWTAKGAALTWWGSTDVWAPDVSLHGSTYWLYYCRSTFGSKTSEIYLATSTTLLPGSWTDKGVILASGSNTTYNAIDPSAVVDASGKWWVVFGSWYDGIYIFSVDSSGKRTSTPKQIAQRPSTVLEGAAIYRKGSYYYLFMSFGNCCPTSAGVIGSPGEKYHIVACRSATIDGTYVDAGGVSCKSGGYLEILAGHDKYWAVGGQSIYYDSSDSHDLLVYHWYDSSNSYTPKLGINFLTWDSNGWPIAN